MAKTITKDQIEKATGVAAGRGWGREPMQTIHVRLHPDLLRAINKKTASERRKFTDVVRDLLAKGLASEGTLI